MKNPLVVRVESWVGSIIILVFSAFLVGLFMIAVKNFGSDAEILSSSGNNLRTVSAEERMLIDDWLVKSDPGLSVKEVGYRYLIRKFPDKPWAGQ